MNLMWIYDHKDLMPNLNRNKPEVSKAHQKEQVGAIDHNVEYHEDSIEYGSLHASEYPTD